jgi:hypothetical protein
MKGWRRIVVDDVTYAWTPSERVLEILGPVSGCPPLRFELDEDAVLTPAGVAAIIRAALADGWDPVSTRPRIDPPDVGAFRR